MNFRMNRNTRRGSFTGVAAFLVLATFAQPPAGYYDSAEGLSGQPLRIALHNIIDNHAPLSYNGLWNAFESTDAKPGNKVWDMYSDIPGSTPPYVYTFGTDQCGEYNSEGDCYNREHGFPNSWFNGSSPMYTDLFHIYPTDGWVNNKRGDLPYGDVGSADWTGQNGSKRGLCINLGYNSTVFEPIDAYKGDFARSYFYMMTRYYGEMSSWSTPMMQGGDLAPWAMAVMVEWSDLDPVSTKETARNNAVFAIQDNRNPYIDRPEWVHAIWGTILGIPESTGPEMSLRRDATGLHVQRGTALPGTLFVHDVAGRTLLTSPVGSGSSDIAFSGPGGIYVAEVISPDGRSMQRFVW